MSLKLVKTKGSGEGRSIRVGGAHLQLIFIIKVTVFFKRVVETSTMGCMRNLYRIKAIVFRKCFPSLVHAWSRIYQGAAQALISLRQEQEQEEIRLRELKATMWRTS
jgi:hypothetical protein